jgi:tetratricopeptide (TPR) repeat protein
MDAELLFKVAKCQYELGDASAAIQDLSSIPSTFLDVSMLTTLAHWHKGVNRITEAIQLYKQAYQLAPYALELLEIIFSLKADDVEIQKMLKTYHTAPHSDSVSSSEVTSESESTATSTQGELKSPVPKLNVNPPDWMQNLITGIHRHYKYESEKALENFQRLNPIFPKNVYLMRLTAQAWVHHEVEEQAISLYRQIQRCDAHYIQDMDRFSVLLYKKSVKQTTDNDDETLQLLSNNLMDSSQASAPEALTSVAYYCLLKSEFETALTFADRAIAASKGQHAEAWRCRGAIRSKSDSYDLSAVLTDYIRANALEKDIASFVGLIETNIEMKKYRDAAIAGKEMVLLYPKSARALFTLGTIMSKSPQGERETIKAYCKALRLNPCLLDATLALCARYLALGNNEDAENCAKQALKHETHPSVLILLSKALSNQSRYSEALDHLRLSCSILSTQPMIDASKIQEEATQEIERIEGILREENGMQMRQEQMAEDDGDSEQEIDEEGVEDYAYMQEGDDYVEDDDA